METESQNPTDRYMAGDTEIAVALRKHYIFKIVPMLNPDGVIVGNTRCNLAGADLNRQYKHAVKEAFPTVYHVKALITKLLENDHSISIYCDLHAHSRKYNVFMYGCENRYNPHDPPHSSPISISEYMKHGLQHYCHKSTITRLTFYSIH